MIEGIADGIQRPLTSFSPVQVQKSGERGKPLTLRSLLPLADSLGSK